MEIKSAVQKSLIDLRSGTTFTEDEFDVLEDILSALKPIKTAVELLGSRQMTLLSADANLKFLLSKLKQTNRPIFQKFFALQIRINERRTDLFAVAQYLHNPIDICNNNNVGLDIHFAETNKNSSNNKGAN